MTFFGLDSAAEGTPGSEPIALMHSRRAADKSRYAVPLVLKDGCCCLRTWRQDRTVLRAR